MKEIVLKINGMMCGGCENRVKNALENIEGIEKVTADHNTGKVKISLHKEIPQNILENTIEDIGYEIVKED